MFGTEIEGEPSLLWFLIQQFAVPLLPWLAAIALVEEIEVWTRVPGLNAGENWILDFAVYSAASFLPGLVVGYSLPTAYRMGRLVWIIPATVFVAAFV